MSINKVELIECSTFLREEPCEPELPVLVTARFELLSDRAALQIASNNTPALFLQIIHEGREGLKYEVIRGGQTGKPLFVHDAEGIVLIARYEGNVIANAFLEVRPALVESGIGILMNPTNTVNMIVEQVDTAGSERRIASEARRESPGLDETIQVSAVKVGGA